MGRPEIPQGYLMHEGGPVVQFNSYFSDVATTITCSDSSEVAFIYLNL